MQRYPPPELEAAVVFCGKESLASLLLQNQETNFLYILKGDSAHTDIRDIIWIQRLF